MLNKDNIAQNELIQNLINNALSKNKDITPQNTEKIKSIINSLTNEDINKITQMLSSGDLSNFIKNNR